MNSYDKINEVYKRTILEGKKKVNEATKIDKKYNVASFLDRAKKIYDYDNKIAKSADKVMRDLEANYDVKSMAFKPEGNAYFIYVEFFNWDKPWVGLNNNDEKEKSLEKRYSKNVDLVTTPMNREPSFSKYNLYLRIRG